MKKFKYKGNVYELISYGKVKDVVSGLWLESEVYRGYNDTTTRAKYDFDDKFIEITNP